MIKRALDLFCAQGGMTRGLQLSGFRVTGVDILPQPRYVGDEFHQADALEFLKKHGHEFDLVVGSPPCDAYTNLAKQHGTQGDHPRLIAPMRKIAKFVGVPYVIENVESAKAEMEDPILLCGEMFPGLKLFRHRLFEAGNGLVLRSPSPGHTTDNHHGRIGVGGYVTMTGNTGGRSRRDGIQHGRKADWERASGIDWMTVDGLREAIPPAYARYIGDQAMVQILECAA